MNSTKTIPDENLKAVAPSSFSFKQRILAALTGLLTGAILGSIVGAIPPSLIGGLFSWGIVLIIIGVVVGGMIGAIYGALYGMLHGAIVGTMWWTNGGQIEYRQTQQHRKKVIHLVCLGTVAVLAAYAWSVEAAKLPIPSEVQSMTLRVYEAKEAESVSVASEDFPTVLNALGPARRDWSPAKWIGIGEITMTCKDGRKTTVDLYRTSDSIGAFSVHPDDRPRNSSFVSNYFRGGTDNSIEDAIKVVSEKAVALKF